MTTQKINTLENLLTKFEERQKSKIDLVVPAPKMLWTPESNLIIERAAGEASVYEPNELLNTQIAGKLGIPVQYFRKMQNERPELLAENVNGWLNHFEDKKYLIRGFTKLEDATIEGRAFLSDSYNIIDDAEVLFAALEAIKNTGVQVKIDHSQITDTRFYLHVTCPEVEYNAEQFLRNYLKENDALGNGIISGFTIANSEVGCGAFEVRPRAVIVKCNNGLIMKDDRFRRVHLGGKMEAGEIVWSERTRKRNRDLIISQVQDAVKTYLSPQYLGVMVEKLAKLHEIKLEYPVDAVQNVCKSLSIDTAHQNEILQYFLGDGVKNAAGLYHAITRETQNMDADSQYDIEGRALEFMYKPKMYDKPFSKN